MTIPPTVEQLKEEAMKHDARILAVRCEHDIRRSLEYLHQAAAFLRSAKRKLAPNTNNSHVDEYLKRLDEFTRELSGKYTP